MSSGSSLEELHWRDWAQEVERRRREGTQVLRRIVIGSVDVRKAGQYFSAICSLVEVVDLWFNPNIDEEQWQHWAKEVERRRREGTQVLRRIWIGSVDVKKAGQYFSTICSLVEEVELRGSTVAAVGKPPRGDKGNHPNSSQDISNYVL